MNTSVRVRRCVRGRVVGRVGVVGSNDRALPRFACRCAVGSCVYVTARDRPAKPRGSRQWLYRSRVCRTHSAEPRRQENRPRRLGDGVSAGADATIQNEFAHTEGAVLRRLVSVLRALAVADLEPRSIRRPEGKRDESVAFPKFLATDLAYCGPFPERSQFYLVYIFSQLIIGLLSGEFYVVHGFLRLEWEPGPRVGPRGYPYWNTPRGPGVQLLLWRSYL